MKLAITTATYNEAKNIQKLLLQVVAAVKGYDEIEFGIFVLDDKSPDGTADIVRKFAKTVKAKNISIEVISGNKAGYGNAYLKGFQKILADKRRWDFVLTMDADLQHNPKYIKQFIKHAQNGYDFVVASRYTKGGSAGDGKFTFKRLLSSVGNIYTKLLLGRQITDYTGGYNMYSREVLQKVKEPKNRAYGFLPELKSNVLRVAQKVTMIPIVFEERHGGESKMPTNIVLSNLLLVTKLGIRNFNVLNAALIALATIIVIIITSALLVKIAGDTDSRNLYLYHSDSTITANFAKDLFSGDRLAWDMSTQIFIFPELPAVLVPYLISSFFNNPFLTQVINSFLTVGLFAIIMYFFAKYTLRNRVKAYVFMLVSLGLFVLMAVSENFLSSVGSLSYTLLINTYYYGATLTAILGLLFIMVILDKTDGIKNIQTLAKNKRMVIASVLLCVFFGLSLASDSLYIAWFLIPMVVVLFVLYILNSIGILQLFLSYATLTTGLVLSKIFVTISTILGITQKNEGGFTRYISIDRIPQSLETLRLFIKANHLQLEISLVLALIALSSVFILFYMYRLTRNTIRTKSMVTAERNLLTINLFVVAMSVFVVMLFFMAGQLYILRYLSILAFVPMLALLSIFKLVNKHRLTEGLGTVTVIAIVLLCSVVILINNSRFKSLTSFDRSDSIACVVDYFNKTGSGSRLYVAADKFDAKTIDYFLHNENIKILDSEFNQNIQDYHWLTNTAMFEDKNNSSDKLNYVIFRAITQDESSTRGNLENISKLIPAQPDDTYSCGEKMDAESTMLVYYYKTGSEGWKYLNGIKTVTP